MHRLKVRVQTPVGWGETLIAAARDPEARGLNPYFRYFSGIGFPSRSASQRIVITFHAGPSFTSWKLLMPRANGLSPGARRDS